MQKIYKCEICGNIVDVLHAGAGALVCCGQSMNMLDENITDAAVEKHIPIVEDLPGTECQVKDGVIVKVGEVDHPMTEDHFIEWIEIETEGGKKGRKFLQPGDEPKAVFYTRKKVVKVVAYCNLHGLWVNNLEK